MMRTRLFTFVLIVGLAPVASAQEADTTAAETARTSANGWIHVESNLDDGVIYLGETLLGHLDQTPFEVDSGEYVVTLAEADREAWDARQAQADVVVRAGRTADVRLDVPYRYRVESFPYGATVTLGDGDEALILGETPLSYETDEPLDGDLVVTARGHLSARQPAGAELDNHYSFVLRPFDATAEGAAEIGWRERKEPNTWIDVAAVGLALTAGAAAVYYKFEGDDLYDEYVETGDPSLPAQFERYDTYSAIALGAMQVGIGVFAIRLVLR